MNDQHRPQQLQRRRKFFAENFSAIGQGAGGAGFGLANTCPACGYLTLDERVSWEICSICNWEDDGQDDMESDEVWGGPNGDYSLTAFRLEITDVLAALQDELKAPNSREAIAGLELKTLQGIIDAYQPIDKQRLMVQLQHTIAAFDSLWQPPGYFNLWRS